jgi:hypothetical protein
MAITVLLLFNFVVIFIIAFVIWIDARSEAYRKKHPEVDQVDQKHGRFK